MEFITPDFTRCNLNISATLAEFLGVPNRNATLPLVKAELDKGYKNVVFICFDGLGIYPMSKNLSQEDFLARNIKQILLSTFPSTTTNATTSLMMNQLPLEHGWFGWSEYYEHLDKNVDIFLKRDSWTGERLESGISPLGKLDYYFDHAESEYAVHSVFPAYVGVAKPEQNHVFSGMQEFFDIIKEICVQDGKQFVYAYYPDPDSTMHKYGVSSPEAKDVIESISNQVKNLYDDSEDTLLIITADHGQIDVTGYVNFYEDEMLMDMLRIYPYMEARAPAFLVKEGKEREFEEYFRSKYGEDFVLYKSRELIERGYFGDFGDKAALLGDYIAVGTYTHKQAVFTPKMKKFKGHHTSLTEEMEVPLILLGKK